MKMHLFKAKHLTTILVTTSLFLLNNSVYGQKNDTLSTTVIKGKSFDFVLYIDTVHEYNKINSDTFHYFNIHALEVYHSGAKNYRQKDCTFLQYFPIEVKQLELWRYDAVPTRFVDVNFDGYKDFEMLHFSGMYWNNYQYFIYDPEKKKFIKDPYLTELTDPTFHPEKEYIHYNWHIGVNEFGHAVFQWKNDTLLLLGKEVINYYEEDQVDCIRLKRINGELKECDCLESSSPVLFGLGPCRIHSANKEECELFEYSTQE